MPQVAVHFLFLLLVAFRVLHCSCVSCVVCRVSCVVCRVSCVVVCLRVQALYRAVIARKEAMAYFLIRSGANSDIPTKHGHTVWDKSDQYLSRSATQRMRSTTRPSLYSPPHPLFYLLLFNQILYKYNYIIY